MPTRLERYERRYRALTAELAAELADIGLISPGSLVVRTTSCGKPGCRCQADPPQRHGPYYQYSRAVAGKTISRRLDERQAELYHGWIANRQRIEQILTQMEKISAEAAEILLQADPPTPPNSR
ncbi:MAG TPA: DUF6788 family protein [Streptosporangiaceae bacterium]|nr:DUF6788 family protein [Streptosporangiaceae bacterium]